MRITCPSCAAEYELGATLAPGRVVRCARCANQWAPVPPIVEAAPPPLVDVPPPAVEVAPAVAPVVEVVTPPSPQPFMVVPADARLDGRPAAPARRATGLALAWLGSALLIVALLAGGYVLRAPIMQAWPPSTRLYSALGLA